MNLRVLSVAAEFHPMVKTGGLADVVAALPSAVAPEGVEMTTLVPGYPAVLEQANISSVTRDYVDLLGCPGKVLQGAYRDAPLLILDAPELFRRVGGPYADQWGVEWPDNWRRFGALARAGADIAAGFISGSSCFDVLQAHDWHAGLAPAYVRYDPLLRLVPTVMTVHNLAFQGWFDGTIFQKLNLPKGAWDDGGIEAYGGVNFLKAGLTSATAITTVSPSYAREIQDAGQGAGLEGLLRRRNVDLSGILNGIDERDWNPATDPALEANYSTSTLGDRKINRRALIRELNIDGGSGPVFAIISRLTTQKGMDLVATCIDALVAGGGRLAILGAGDPAIEAKCLQAMRDHPGRVAVHIGFDEALAHRLQGGADAILIPSRSEPCGLTQLCALVYGCIPVVANTGGLADTVVDLSDPHGTGVVLDGTDEDGLLTAIRRTIALFGDQAAWRAVQRRGMAADHSWRRSGRDYATLFKRVAAASG